MNSMIQWMRHADPMAERSVKPPLRRRSFEAPLIELLRPFGYWPQPLSIEQAFELFRWMVATGASKPEYTSQLQWGRAGVPELLSSSSGLSHDRVEPIVSIEDLRRRFHMAILARPQSRGQELWRQEHDIGPTSVVNVPSPTFKPFAGAPHLGWRSEQTIHDDLKRMFEGSAGTQMVVSLNSQHEGCRTLHGVRISVHPEYGFGIAIRYGDTHPTDWGSSWDEPIARTREGETFLQTLARARDVFDCLVHGHANECDLGDMQRYYKPEHVSRQVAALHGRAPTDGASSPAPC